MWKAHRRALRLPVQTNLEQFQSCCVPILKYVAQTLLSVLAFHAVLIWGAVQDGHGFTNSKMVLSIFSDPCKSVLSALSAVRFRVFAQNRPQRYFSARSICTNCQPKRPLIQRLPCVTEWSRGEVTFTISPSCSCTVRLHPTPQ